MADETSGLGGRFRRYARVTGTMGNLALKMAGERYLGIKIDREEHATKLRDALGGLKGPLMKVAQILATIPEALPREYAEQLANLQTDAPSMGWLFVKRRMASELGPDWQSRFADFEKTAAAAASLGQVHRATSHDGLKLACKLQYPDMASAVQADLRQLKLIFSLYERYDKAISTSDIHTELAERLEEELNYKREASNMRLYRYMLDGVEGANVPDTIDDLSSERLLTMTWVEGIRLKAFIENNEDQESRNRVAENMFRTWYVPFYYYGVIHGDPHPGNYTITPDGSVNLLDYGCIRLFRPDFVRGVIELYKALRDNNEEQAVTAYEYWGFKGLDRETVNVLNIWARFIYTPLLEDRARPIQEMRGGAHGRELAMQVHAELKRIGGVKPPREFVLMDRAALGLGSVFMHLKAEVNWHRLFEGMIDDFDVDVLRQRQIETADKAGLPSYLWQHDEGLEN
ncbi:MAG: AarF/UbiB family protein [Proteobacteria bacterium]|nr:AarF/UbiB family protein [Pseudomonadota bacterium]